MKMYVHIKLENAKEAQAFISRLAGEEKKAPVTKIIADAVPSAVPVPTVPPITPLAEIIEKAKGHMALKTAETGPESAEREAPQEIPHEAEEPPAEPVISEDQAVALRVACEKFCAQAPDGKKKIRQFLKDKGVKRITALPVSLFAEFQSMVAL